MAASELSTGKSVIVLGVIVACFAVLWPKIFYPMFEVALRSTTKQPIKNQENIAMVHPRVRQHLMRDIRYQKTVTRNQPFSPSHSIRPIIGGPKVKESGGIINLLMPFYTIGIFVVFLYTILKFMSKDDKERDEELEEPVNGDDHQPIIKDFQMDPDYRKFVLSEEYDDDGQAIRRDRVKSSNSWCKKRCKGEKGHHSKSSLNLEETFADCKKDDQIFELKRRLKVTEDAMERILRHVGSLNQLLEAKGLLYSEISNITGYKEPDEIFQSEDEQKVKLSKKGDIDTQQTSGDSVYSSDNQDQSSTDYDSDSSLSTTSSRYEIEE